jgi:hypothetical protein
LRVSAKPAVVVGIAQAQRRAKKPSNVPAARPPLPPPGGRPPMHLRDDAAAQPQRARAAPPQPTSMGRTPAAASGNRRPVPPPFSDEPTRQVDDDLLNALRSQPASIPPSTPSRPSFSDEPTRMAKIDPRAYDETPIEERTRPPERVATPSAAVTTSPRPKFPPQAPTTAPSISEFENHGDEAARGRPQKASRRWNRARNGGVAGAKSAACGQHFA